jgi:hypothetical protein
VKFISIFTHQVTNRQPTREEMDRMEKLIADAMKEGWLLATEGVTFGGVALRIHKPAGSGAITVTDGPFTEAKEVLGGYALIEAASRAKVIELTKRFLEVAGQGTCEIHQLFEMPTT